MVFPRGNDGPPKYGKLKFAIFYGFSKSGYCCIWMWFAFFWFEMESVWGIYGVWVWTCVVNIWGLDMWSRIMVGFF